MSDPPESAPLPLALLLADQRRRWQAGRPVPVEAYLERQPALQDNADAILDLVYNEVILREQRGEAPRAEEYLERFPRWAAQVRLLFEMDRAFQPATPPPVEHVSAAPGLGSTVDHPAPPFASFPTPQSPALPPSLGRYRILRRLGGGGMGEVYLAHDPLLERPVALKVPRFHPGHGPEVVERFYREARAAARLAHPNLCPIYDVGDSGGTPYLAMAYLEGQPLSDLLRDSGPLPARRAAEMVSAIARALEEAHRQGVVHRDLKPANVMVNPRGEPVVMDFGLARQTEAGGERLTSAGALLGTPAYMAPEQVRGDATAGEALWDVYSLGVVLYELLAGRPPFQGPVALVLARVVSETPPPPSQHRPDLDSRLEAICRKAMARAPGRRFASMKEFADALSYYLQVVEPGNAAIPPEVPQGKRASRRRRNRRGEPEGLAPPSGELLAAHADLVGRQSVLEHVRDFVRTHDRGLLVVTGGPGKGKTALLAHLAGTVFVGHDPPPVHFFYRRTAGITDPDLCVRSLYHALRAAHQAGDPRRRGMPGGPERVFVKLCAFLADRVAGRVGPDRPQFILLDALDESLPTASGKSAFARIPEELPPGVFVIATTRPVVERTALARRRDLHWFDLDAPERADEDLRDGTEYAARELAGSGLDESVLGEIARAGAGNFLVLKLLCEHIRAAPEPGPVADLLRRLSADGGHDRLGFIYEEFWERLMGPLPRADQQLLCDVAGLLVTAWAPLAAEMISRALDLRSAEWDFALRHLAGYLTAVRVQGGGPAAYRVYHESFAEFVRDKVAVDRGRLEHRLADYCLAWSRVPEGHPRGYALRFGPTHLRQAERWDDLEGLLTDGAFLEAKAEAGLAADLVEDLAAARRAAPPGRPRMRLLALLEEGLRTDVQFIVRHPAALFACLWNRCWWYDCPEAAHHYDPPEGGWPPEGPPWQRPGLKISALMETWRAAREAAQPGFPWARSLRSPEVHLGTAQRAVFRGHEGEANGVSLSPDGTRIASGSADGTIRIWDARSGEELAHVGGHQDRVWGVAFAPDGRRVASASWDRTVRVWDTHTGEELVRLRGHKRRAWSVAFSPDGAMLASGSDNAAVRVWHARSGKELLCLRGHEGPVWTVAFAPDGHTLASASDDATVRLWDAGSGAELGVLRGHGEEVMAVAFAPDGRTLASGSGDRTLRIWDVRSRQERFCLHGHRAWVAGVAFSPDGERIASASADGTVRVWDALAGREIACLHGHTDAAWGVAFAPDGWLVSSSWDRTVRVWDVQAGGAPARLHGHQDLVEHVAFSPDGREVVSCGRDRTVRLWETATGRQRSCFAAAEGVVRAVAFSPDSTRILCGSDDGAVRVRDAATGGERACLCGHHGPVWAVAFSPDGRLIASASDDRTVRLWDAEAGTEWVCLHGHAGWVSWVAFSADGKLLASASSDRTVRVWDVAGGERACLRGHESPVVRVAFSADGRQVISAAFDRTVRTWDWASGICLEEAEGMQDVGALAAGVACYPWRAVARETETVIHSALGGKVLARLPAVLRRIVTHPAGRSWAGAYRGYLHLFALEGADGRRGATGEGT
jgi:WD40 repeat protein